MPSYTFICEQCDKQFEVISSIRDYTEKHPCPICNTITHTYRCYIEDVATINSSIKKSDDQLKTLGDLANRNRDRLSDTQKEELYIKHNEYKEKPSKKELPQGFRRLPKQPKTKWT